MESYKPEEWFTAKERGVRCSRLREPYQNIFVGSDPLDGMTEAEAKSFDAIVNVSCSPCAYFHPAFPGQAMHWYPINEIGAWGLGPFYWFKKVMDFHFDKGHRIYVHCHAGAYRSPTFTIFWLISRGHTHEEACEIEYNNPELVKQFKTERRGRHWKWKLSYPYRMGNISPEVTDLFRRMNLHPTYSFGGIVHNPSIAWTPEVWGAHLWSARWRQKWFGWWYGPLWQADRFVDYWMHYVRGWQIDRSWRDNGWHVTPRGGRLAAVCRWIDSKAKAFAYRLSKLKWPIFSEMEESPTISLS